MMVVSRWAAMLAVVIVMCAAAAGVLGIVISANGAAATSQNTIALRNLLLSGKTASAQAARKTAQEIPILQKDLANVLYLVTYVKSAQGRSGHATAMFLAALERHIDATIARDLRHP